MKNNCFYWVLIISIVFLSCKKDLKTGIKLFEHSSVKTKKFEIIIHGVLKSKDTYVYTYDDQGRLIRLESIERPIIFITYKYDNNFVTMYGSTPSGSSSSKIFLNNHDLVDSTISFNSDSTAVKYKYDNQDRLIQQTIYSYSSAAGWQKKNNLIYQYDAKGNAISTTDDVTHILESDNYDENLSNNRPFTDAFFFKKSGAYESSANLVKYSSSHYGANPVFFDLQHKYTFDADHRMVSDTVTYVGDNSFNITTWTY